ncbi:MAG: TonB-dependent receptor plug domain-containing protein, partial [Gemmatimonadetes bacterium]|nr:TonB-dependent receptor plug domain-containing protein [Gemmatimonadota bacterium]
MRRRPWLLLVAPLVWPAALAAQESPVYRMGEIVVSAERPVSEAAATLRVVTAEEIEASGARTLDEALALVPGLDVRTGGQGVPRVDFRGFRPRHVILLLDGIPFNADWDGQADPSLIPVEDIAMIKVTPATGSVLYGEGGLAGVINIVTRRGAGAPHGRASAEAREVNGRLLRASGGAGSDRLGVLVSASALRSDGYPSPAGSPTLAAGTGTVTRPNSDRRRTNLFANVTATPTPSLDLGLVLTDVRGAYGIPPGVIVDAADPFASRPTFERMASLHGTAGQLAAAYHPAGIVSVRGWGFVHRLTEEPRRYDDATYTDMDDPTVRGTYRERDRTTLSGANVQVAVAPRRLGRLTLGLSAERDALDLALTIRDVPTSGSGGGGGG